jgi:hypothetical protein
MTRRVILVSVVVALLCVAGTALAATAPPAEKLPGTFLGTVQPDMTYTIEAHGMIIGSVVQKVSSWDVDSDGEHDFYAYTYTVANTKPGTYIVKFGFVEPWLDPVYATADGFDTYDFGAGGVGTLFNVTPHPDGVFPVADPMLMWELYAAPGYGMGIPVPENMNGGMGALAKGGPDHYYDFTVWWDHDADLQPDQWHTIKVSGPTATPEPCALGLLGLSGLAIIRLLKRKRE